jgi:hypothetical protein
VSQRAIDPGDDAGRCVSVETLTRLAIQHLTDEQLIDLLTRLEQELVRRARPADDYLIAERPRLGRID